MFFYVKLFRFIISSQTMKSGKQFREMLFNYLSSFNHFMVVKIKFNQRNELINKFMHLFLFIQNNYVIHVNV